MRPVPYDLTIIGSGPGGYAAAIRAKELGVKVCIIEKELLGGVCLNKGCIPTKAIVHSAEVLGIVKRANEFGIRVSGCDADIAAIYKRKDDIVSKLRSGMEANLKSKGIDIIRGSASFKDSVSIKVEGNNIESKYFIIATGSVAIETDALKFDHKRVLSSDDILNLNEVPESITIIGGGSIGCEFAYIYNRFGSKVTVIEAMDQLLPRQDKEIAKRLEASFKKSGIEVIKGRKEDGLNINSDKVLLCIGRRPNVAALNLEAAGVICEDGRIPADETLRTNIRNIYAIGDVTGRNYLAHAASYEGTIATDNIFGATRSADYTVVPNCIYTMPEAASVGYTEEEAVKNGFEVAITKVPLAAISKNQIIGETDGFVKLIGDKKSDKILGAHIFGVNASELIAIFTTAKSRGITISGLKEVIFAHPTLSESVSEAVSRAK